MCTVGEILEGMEKRAVISEELSALRDKRSRMSAQTQEARDKYNDIVERRKKLQRSVFKRRECEEIKRQEQLSLYAYNEHKNAEEEIWHQIDLKNAELKELKYAAEENLISKTQSVLLKLENGGYAQNEIKELSERKEAAEVALKIAGRCQSYITFINEEIKEIISMYSRDSIPLSIRKNLFGEERGYRGVSGEYNRFIERINSIISVYTRKYNIMISELRDLDIDSVGPYGSLLSLEQRTVVPMLSGLYYYNPEQLQERFEKERAEMRSIYDVLSGLKEHLADEAKEYYKSIAELEETYLTAEK